MARFLQLSMTAGDRVVRRLAEEVTRDEVHILRCLRRRGARKHDDPVGADAGTAASNAAAAPGTDAAGDQDRSEPDHRDRLPQAVGQHHGLGHRQSHGQAGRPDGQARCHANGRHALRADQRADRHADGSAVIVNALGRCGVSRASARLAVRRHRGCWRQSGRSRQPPGAPDGHGGCRHGTWQHGPGRQAGRQAHGTTRRPRARTRHGGPPHGRRQEVGHADGDVGDDDQRDLHHPYSTQASGVAATAARRSRPASSSCPSPAG